MRHGLQADGPVDLRIKPHGQHAPGLFAADAQFDQFFVLGHAGAAGFQVGFPRLFPVGFGNLALAPLLIHLGLEAEGLGHEVFVLLELHVAA